MDPRGVPDEEWPVDQCAGGGGTVDVSPGGRETLVKLL